MSNTVVEVTYTQPQITLDVTYVRPVIEIDVDGTGISTSTGTNTFTVSSLAAMLALLASKGDIAIRADLNKVYRLATTPATTESNWVDISVGGSATNTFSLVSWSPTLGQTIFPFPPSMTRPDISHLYVNGLKYRYGIDYSVNTLSSSLSWNGFLLDERDEVQLYYL